MGCSRRLKRFGIARTTPQPKFNRGLRGLRGFVFFIRAIREIRGQSSSWRLHKKFFEKLCDFRRCHYGFRKTALSVFIRGEKGGLLPCSAKRSCQHSAAWLNEKSDIRTRRKAQGRILPRLRLTAGFM